jgi:two-component system alkaline phosphatase synthesis response regulator PhoP
MSPKFILAIDSDKAHISSLRTVLEQNKFEVVTASTFSESREIIKNHRPDLIILADEMKASQAIRTEFAVGPYIPIIFIQANLLEFERMMALECGADDVIGKPLPMGETIARIKSSLRRSDAVTCEPIRRHGSIEIDPGQQTVRVDGKEISLTFNEFMVLEYLSRRSPDYVTREEIIDNAMDSVSNSLPRSADYHIYRIRKKLGDARRRLWSKRRVGYKID